MEGVKAFLTRQLGPFPVYAYIVGGLVMVAAIVYFRGKANTGPATASPQTNYPTDNSGNPYPYPNPGSGAPGVPPSSAFDLPTSGALIPQYASQANFVSAAMQPTASQSFAASQPPPPLPDYFGGTPTRPSNTSSSTGGLSNFIKAITSPGYFSSSASYVPRRTGAQQN